MPDPGEDQLGRWRPTTAGGKQGPMSTVALHEDELAVLLDSPDGAVGRTSAI